VYIDLSWTEVAKYVTDSPEATANVAAVINKYPDRFLFGTDEVAPSNQASYLKILDMYKPLLDKLTPEAKQKFLKGNYERLFDAARIKVRAWEKAHTNDPNVVPTPTPSSGIGKE
jgi:predicted TIM-barrel fold metal-dependent hydrolase